MRFRLTTRHRVDNQKHRANLIQLIDDRESFPSQAPLAVSDVSQDDGSLTRTRVLKSNREIDLHRSRHLSRASAMITRACSPRCSLATDARPAEEYKYPRRHQPREGPGRAILFRLREHAKRCETCARIQPSLLALTLDHLLQWQAEKTRRLTAGLLLLLSSGGGKKFKCLSDGLPRGRVTGDSHRFLR